MIDALKFASWKVQHHSSRISYEHLCWIIGARMATFSEYKLFKILTETSGVVPQILHCYLNSCVLFVGKHANATICYLCKVPQFLPGTQTPQNRFLYYPLIPRLQAFYTNSLLSHIIHTYRADYKHNPQVISDVFNGNHYRSLLSKKVSIQLPDGTTAELPHFHFSDNRDIAFAMFSDSYQLFKKSHIPKSATPIILVNLNLPPMLRTQLENLICLGVIPGPHTPKDYNSFFYPAYTELLELSRGVLMTDYATGHTFHQHSYVIFKSGDLPDQAKFLGYKRHSAKCPCSHCLATGVWVLRISDVDQASTNYYIPLCPPLSHPANTPSWDPRHLPLRTAENLQSQLQEIDSASTNADHDGKAMQYGLNGTSLLERFSSFSWAECAPHDIMHLLFEHMVPMLIQFWKGQYGPWKATWIGTNHMWFLTKTGRRLASSLLRPLIHFQQALLDQFPIFILNSISTLLKLIVSGSLILLLHYYVITGLKPTNTMIMQCFLSQSSSDSLIMIYLDRTLFQEVHYGRILLHLLSNIMSKYFSDLDVHYTNCLLNLDIITNLRMNIFLLVTPLLMDFFTLQMTQSILDHLGCRGAFLWNNSVDH